MELKDVLDKKKAPVETVWIIQNEEGADEYEKLTKQITLLEDTLVRLNGEEPEVIVERLERLQTRREELRENLLKDALKFEFTSIGRPEYRKLLMEHPPSDEQKEEVRKAGGDPDLLQWDPDSFPPRLVSESCTNPKMTKAQAQKIWKSKKWNVAELDALFQGALNANVQRAIADLGKGLTRTQN